MIVLASRSPRRRALLDQIGVRYATLAVDADERRLAGEDAATLVERLARAKAALGRGRLAADDRRPVLGADTAVVIDGEPLGKAADAGEAVALLARLSARTHEVYTAVALARETTAVRLSVSRVRLRRLSARECRAYAATGEPLDKAGGYAIQGLGGAFVERLEGSYSGVVGLPLYETAALLREAGITLL